METVVEHFAQMGLCIQMLTGSIVVNDYLTVWPDGTGVAAFPAPITQRIPILSPMQPYLQNTK
ncbi:MAG: hypothetical protein LUD41_00295 [Phascolarctobacterium sp.]|nr:hypothetical protein [Phascolarctobacterium sp.]